MAAPDNPKTIMSKIKMDDIARLAGVSKSTVSRALSNSPLVNEKTKKKIRELANQHHYILDQRARNFRLQQSHTIGVVFPMRYERDQYISDPFFLDLLGHLADGLTERGYDLLLSKPKLHEASWLDNIVAAKRTDGLILIGQGAQHEIINEFAKNYNPLIVWGAKVEGQAYTVVGSDNVSGAVKATKHMIDQGRRRIAFLGNNESPETSDRYKGYLRAHEEAGLKALDELFIETHMSSEEACEAVCQALEYGLEIDGLMAASDVLALSAIRALKQRGLIVPDDVAVAGYDDIPFASYIDPPLTTVRQDTERAAELLLDRLFKKLEGEKSPSVVIDPELVVRTSAG
ncbi:MAG: LacI family DNA-binding transcriptional regulator [Sphingomonadales bacterium]